MTEVAELLEVCEYILGNLPINSAHEIADLELKLPAIINRAKKDLGEMRARIAELERVLRMVEWIYDPSVPHWGSEIDWCPWCHQELQDNHSADCPRQKVLGE
jgi:hypothetical protein